MRVMLMGFAGGIAGAVLTDVFGPDLVKWWATPPVRTTCDCSDNMAWAMSHLVYSQLIVTIAGAVLFIGLYLIFFRRKQPPVSS
jgi:hypothetical protein